MPKTTKKSAPKRAKAPVRKVSVKARVTKQPHITETVFGAFALFVIAVISLYLIQLTSVLR